MGARSDRRRERESQVLGAFPNAKAVLTTNEVAGRLSWGRNRDLVHQTLRRLAFHGYLVELPLRGPRRYRLATGEDA